MKSTEMISMVRKRTGRPWQQIIKHCQKLYIPAVKFKLLLLKMTQTRRQHFKYNLKYFKRSSSKKKANNTITNQAHKSVFTSFSIIFFLFESCALFHGTTQPNEERQTEQQQRQQQKKCVQFIWAASSLVIRFAILNPSANTWPFRT